jgi:hypothetical protein
MAEQREGTSIGVAIPTSFPQVTQGEERQSASDECLVAQFDRHSGLGHCEKIRIFDDGTATDYTTDNQSKKW